MAATQDPVPGGYRVDGEPRQTTLGDHGWTTIVGGQKLGLEPLDLEFRRQIGLQVDRDPAASRVGWRMMRAVALSVTQLGSEKLAGLPLDERQVIVGAMRLQDLMYIAFLRLADEDEGRYTLHHDTDTCPHCKAPLPDTCEADLYTLPLRVWDRAPRVTYRLARPWRCRGIDVETVTLEPPRLVACMEPTDEETWNDTLLRELLWVSASVVQLNDTPIQLVPEDLTARNTPGPRDTLRGIRRVDWRGLFGAFAAVTLADVGMSVKVKHEACGRDVPVSLDWSQGFFAPTEG